jgi:carbamoyltransferase
LNATAQLIERGEVVGWFQGRMEYGPRALGNRSILADPRRPEMRSLINKKVKFRETFRPFAPAVLQEKANNYFEMPQHCQSSPYMTLVSPVRDCQQDDVNDFPSAKNWPVESNETEPLNIRCTKIPAVTHVDYSARVQTVDGCRNHRFYQLLKSFELRTGCPILINTSFNVRGEPIVCSPEDALRCFWNSGLDSLVMGDFLIKKSEQQRGRDDE